eukprot:scaffold156546_cov17-Prasinocladus_malaysianus.AAC.7
MHMLHGLDMQTPTRVFSIALDYIAVAVTTSYHTAIGTAMLCCLVTTTATTVTRYDCCHC